MFWANFHHLVTPKKKGGAENFTNVFLLGKKINGTKSSDFEEKKCSKSDNLKALASKM
jgi:hypothetical protein